MRRILLMGRLFLIVVSLLPASCSDRGRTEVTTPTEKTSPTADGLVRAVGLCANRYYPIYEGATWKYKSTGARSGDYEFAETITEVHEDGFTVTTQIGDEPRVHKWTCTREGLVTQQLSNSASAAMSSQCIGLDIEMKSISGVTFPQQMREGMEWTQDLEFIGKVDVTDTSATAGGRAHTDFVARGIESVTVPAGTFDAMKVDTVTTIDTSVVVQGFEVPSTFKSTSTFWYVKDVGWIKTINEGEVGGQTFTEVIELQSSSIP